MKDRFLDPVRSEGKEVKLDPLGLNIFLDAHHSYCKQTCMMILAELGAVVGAHSPSDSGG